jgi:hypothetical protein
MESLPRVGLGIPLPFTVIGSYLPLIKAEGSREPKALHSETAK